MATERWSENRRAVCSGWWMGKIKTKKPTMHRGGVGGGSLFLHVFLHPILEYGSGEGFHNVVVRSRLQRLDDDICACDRSEPDHRDVGGSPRLEFAAALRVLPFRASRRP